MIYLLFNNAKLLINFINLVYSSINIYIFHYYLIIKFAIFLLYLIEFKIKLIERFLILNDQTRK